MHKVKLRISLLAVVICFGTSLPVAAENDKPEVPAAVVNGITQAVVNAGVLTCASRVNQVANFLTTGTQGAGAFLFIPPVNPDQKIVSISMEIPISPGSSAYASASFAPGQANNCGALYETVVYWPTGCDDVAGKNFAAFTRVSTLSKTVVILDGGQTTKVFLQPAGAGCVSIKKEIIQ